MSRMLIVNPNANTAVTGWLAQEAGRVAGADIKIVAVNARSGLEALQTPEDIELAASAVVAEIEARAREIDGAIIAAFGDPGLARARALTRAVGLGETGIRAAGAGGRRFSILTLGAAMREAIAARVSVLGFGECLADISALPFSIPELLADRAARRAEIAEAVRHCAGETVLLGGAPFAGLSAEIADATGKFVLDGVEACVRAFLAK